MFGTCYLSPEDVNNLRLISGSSYSLQNTIYLILTSDGYFGFCGAVRWRYTGDRGSKGFVECESRR